MSLPGILPSTHIFSKYYTYELTSIQLQLELLSVFLAFFPSPSVQNSVTLLFCSLKCTYVHTRPLTHSYLIALLRPALTVLNIWCSFPSVNLHFSSFDFVLFLHLGFLLLFCSFIECIFRLLSRQWNWFSQFSSTRKYALESAGAITAELVWV